MSLQVPLVRLQTRRSHQLGDLLIGHVGEFVQRPDPFGEVVSVVPVNHSPDLLDVFHRRYSDQPIRIQTTREG